MRRIFIAGNWKMNLDRAEAVALASAIAKATPEGIDWSLTAYLGADVDLVDVPFGVAASLRLEDGIASGSG